MKVYVASPVRPILEAEKACEAYALLQIHDYAMDGCLAVKEMGHIPISPILAFDCVYDEFTERDKIDAACEALLLACDAIYIVPTHYNAQSKGIARELEIAEKNGIEILEG